MGEARGHTCARRPGSAPASITFEVLVQPRASRTQFGPRHDGRIKIAVTAPPVDGEANAAVIEVVAEALGIARRAVEIIGGASSRRKRVRVTGVTEAELLELVPLEIVPLERVPR